jgi:signal transduction histidine kinase
MSPAPSILLVDSNAGDRDLAVVLLQRELSGALITPAADAMAFADALAGASPDVTIVAAELAWARVDELIAIIKRRSPTTAVVIFGHESEIVARTLNPGVACDAIVRKSSSGFLTLAAIVTEVIERARRSAAPPAKPESRRPIAEGQRSPDEMRDIAMVFSHDLQEPLQQIVRLARRGQSPADESVAGRSLQRVLECANRASSMLEGTLEYLSVVGRDAAPAPVDLNVCMAKALENLRSSIAESDAKVTSAHLPTTMGDELQLLHLFQNLLSNAIKFRRREPPVISVRAEARDNQWLLSFHDNGIGIPQPFLDRIFTMGQRLHTREEYPGSGMGLALCRRIVERHGGRIWAESGSVDGSTFNVLLPKAGSAEAAR